LIFKQVAGGFVMAHEVVVTGFELVTSLGMSSAETWENLQAGKIGLETTTYDDYPQFGQRALGVIDKTELARLAQGVLGDGFKEKDIRRLHPLGLASTIACNSALRMAGFDPIADGANGVFEEATIIIGTGVGGANKVAETARIIDKYTERTLDDGTQVMVRKGIPGPADIFSVLSEQGAALPAKLWNFQGGAYSINAACASAGFAIANAADLISAGRRKLVVVGGFEMQANEIGEGYFIRTALSRNPDPRLACMPFDSGSDGFALSEGGGVFVMESRESAEKRGAQILLELAGWEISSDAYDDTDPRPDGAVVGRTMRSALKQAGYKGERILVSLHGTGTEKGDPAELNAVGLALDKESAILNATKGSTGHALGGAGIIAAVIAAESARNHTSALMPKTKNLIPGAEGWYMPTKVTEINVGFIACNNLGFNGNNSSIVFKVPKD
jgi:3-oxoacyl-[acyl-carrier-protein] synthase II